MSSGNQRYINTAGSHDITMNDDYINVSTSVGAITLVFPNIRDSGAIPTNKVWFVNDVDDMAATNNVTIVASDTSPVTELNGGSSVVLDTDGFSAEIVPSGYYNYMVNSGISEGGMTGSGTLNYVAKFTPSGTVLGNSQLFDNGSSVGLGTTTPTAGTKFHVYRAVNDFLYEVKIENPTNGASAASSMLIQSDNGKMEFGQLSTLFTTYTGYGQTGDTFIRSGTGARNMNFLTDASNTGKMLFFSRLNPTTSASTPSFAIDGSRSGFNVLPVANTLVYMKGEDATSGAYALKVDNSGSSPLLYVRNDGFVSINQTTIGAAILEITGGAFQGVYSQSNSIGLNGSGTANGSIGVNANVATGFAGTSLYIRSNNASNILIDIVNSSTSPISRMLDNGYFGIGTVAPTSKLQVVGLATYADNAAAITGGLTAGAFYIRTGHGLDVVV